MVKSISKNSTLSWPRRLLIKATYQRFCRFIIDRISCPSIQRKGLLSAIKRECERDQWKTWKHQHTSKNIKIPFYSTPGLPEDYDLLAFIACRCWVALVQKVHFLFLFRVQQNSFFIIFTFYFFFVLHLIYLYQVCCLYYAYMCNCFYILTSPQLLSLHFSNAWTSIIDPVQSFVCLHCPDFLRDGTADATIMLNTAVVTKVTTLAWMSLWCQFSFQIHSG